MANTGRLLTFDLLKVVDGGPQDGQPLDANNNLVSAGVGRVQDEKPNFSTDSDYIPPILDTTACPI